jgi:cytochrome c oxidase subunit 2
MRKSVLLLFTALLLLFVPVIAGAADPDPAKGWDAHFKLWAIISAIVWLSVTVPMVYFVVKYKRKRPDEEGADIHGNTLLEIAWTVVPLIIIILLGTQSWALYRDYRAVPKNAYEVRIEGYQFAFDITYPEGIKTVNELRIPVGTPIKVILSSRDVIHTYSVPKFRVKEDMIPGRTTYMWFKADEPGEYPAYCSEYCGTAHSLMLGKVIAMKKEDFQAWVEQHKAAAASMSPEAKGEKLVKDLGCTGCHSLAGEKMAGTTFKGIFERETALADGAKVKADEAYLKESLTNPKAKVVQGFAPTMPPYMLNEEDMNAVVAYLKTVK